MYYQFDEQFNIACFRELINTPSPVGYDILMNPVLEKYASMFGLPVTYDNKGTAYITVDGQDNSKTVMVSTHLDTLGLVVRRIESDGTLRVRNMGALNFHSAEGETVTVFTRSGKAYTGLLTVSSHSIHVFDDCREMPRDEHNMLILLDERVSSKEDVQKLGIRNGDLIAIEPRFELTPSGFLKSRFIDDKAAVSCCFTMLKYLQEHNLKPKYRTMIGFTYMEEVMLGGNYMPPEVSEAVALDIGCIGPDQDGTEFGVSICAYDNNGPYNYELTTRLINLAEKLGCDYAVDTFRHYGSDCSAAIKGGCNVKVGVFGMAVSCSHGRERTHLEGLRNTMDLLIGYVLGE